MHDDIPPHVKALIRAIQLAGGSQEALAAKLRAVGHPSVTQQTVSHWLRRQIRLDDKWWPFFERAGLARREELRPDIFCFSSHDADSTPVVSP